MVGPAPKISVIIVNYNGQHLLGELFQSLAKQSRLADEVIMVDNASVDGSVAYVQQHFSWVKVIASTVNAGYAEGNNIGVANASGDYIARLNSDTAVDERWLAELIEVLDANKGIGAAVSKIYQATNTPTIDCADAEFLPLILLSLIYCNWVSLREGGPRLLLRSVASQVHYAVQGLVERFRGGSVDTGQWVPWMTKQGLREVLALRSKLGTYVQ
jgi:glycosyltransferase involved in cell wall biosynthesis